MRVATAGGTDSFGFPVPFADARRGAAHAIIRDCQSNGYES